MAEKSKISLVIAAYNEEAVIQENLKRLAAEMEKSGKFDWEIICVDDGSSDKTGVLLDSLLNDISNLKVFHHRRNFGQGRALRTAFDFCTGDFIVTLDADLSYGPEYVFLLVDALREKNVEIALASPYSEGGKVENVPFYRHFLSRFGNLYLAWMSQYPISTSTCVVRAYRREVLDSLIFFSDGTELQLEILMKAAQFGFKVCEIPAKLQWPKDALVAADLGRVSKMRISRSIELYLLLGWLSRPAFFFLILAFLLLLPGGYMALFLFYRLVSFIYSFSSLGLLVAISKGLEEVYKNFTYSIIFSGGLLILGLGIFSFALLLLQNKYYFDEISRLLQYRKKSGLEKIRNG